MSNIAIVGIGNPYRGDDGAGWEVIDRLKVDIPCIKSRGDISELIDLFAQHESLIFIDACPDLGVDWKRVDALSVPINQRLTSTHGFGLSEAIAMAKQLQQLPLCLILYLINGTNFAMSQGLTHAVKESVQQVVEEIERECMNKV